MSDSVTNTGNDGNLVSKEAALAKLGTIMLGKEGSKLAERIAAAKARVEKDKFADAAGAAGYRENGQLEENKDGEEAASLANTQNNIVIRDENSFETNVNVINSNNSMSNSESSVMDDFDETGGRMGKTMDQGNKKKYNVVTTYKIHELDWADVETRMKIICRDLIRSMKD